MGYEDDTAESDRTMQELVLPCMRMFCRSVEEKKCKSWQDKKLTKSVDLRHCQNELPCGRSWFSNVSNVLMIAEQHRGVPVPSQNHESGHVHCIRCWDCSPWGVWHSFSSRSSLRYGAWCRVCGLTLRVSRSQKHRPIHYRWGGCKEHPKGYLLDGVSYHRSYALVFWLCDNWLIL